MSAPQEPQDASCCVGEPGRAGPDDYHAFDCPVYLANVAAWEKRLRSPAEPVQAPASGPDTPGPVSETVARALGAQEPTHTHVMTSEPGGSSCRCGYAPAPQGAGDGREALRDALTAFVHAATHSLAPGCDGRCSVAADAIWPLIEADREAYAEERAAQALRDAADHVPPLRDVAAEAVIEAWLEVRADAVRDAQEATHDVGH